MKRVLFWALAFICMSQALPVAAANGGTGGLIPPPPIHIPYGGKVVTEIHFSDSDVLGIIKQVLPAVGEIIATLAPMSAPPGHPGAEANALAQGASKLDFRELTDALSGIKDVRVIVAGYGIPVDRETMLSQIEAGVAKTGTFSKVLSDMAFSPGVFALYAESPNAGYLGFAYDPGSRMLYAARIVGFVDVNKLTKWAVDAAKLLAGEVRTAQPVPEAPEPPAEPQPEEPEPAPNQ